MSNLSHAPLGQQSEYVDQYDPQLLFPVPRKDKREELGIDPSRLPFKGTDIWNAWELSWLNGKGKPMVATGEIFIPADAPNIIESKSLKLYLNSFNQTRFDSLHKVAAVMEQDLTDCAGAQVKVTVVPVNQAEGPGQVEHLDGICIDDLDVEINEYHTNDALLQLHSDEVVSETLVSHLLKSNCPVTGQPDWGSLVVRYEGKKINRAALLKYVVSFRQHTEFHEQCVERVFVDLQKHCQPEKLTVFARYVRRGGLDINPYRSNFEDGFVNQRLVRQ